MYPDERSLGCLHLITKQVNCVQAEGPEALVVEDSSFVPSEPGYFAITVKFDPVYILPIVYEWSAV